MQSTPVSFSSIDEYIAMFPEATQNILQALRATIHAAAPDAQEKISYQMPTFYLKGNLVYFAAWKNHIGFYPASAGINIFEDELAKYERTKGAIRFPIDQPLPMDLITRMVQLRVTENLNKAAAKATKKKG